MPQIDTRLITSLPGQDIAQPDMSLGNFMQGFKMGMAKADPLEQLKRLSMEQELQMQSFNIQKAFEDRQRVLDAESLAREKSPVIQQMIASDKPHEAQRMMLLETSRNPTLGFSSQWQQMGAMVQASAKMSDTLADNTRMDAAQKETTRHNLAMEARPTSGQVIRTNPDGSVEVISGPMGPGDVLTRTNQSKVQESQAQALATIDIANRLEPLISNETVGVQAFAESWIKDRILAQRFPELASSTRANAEQLSAQLRASAVKELRSDSNITEGERNQIMQAIPEINSPIDSPVRARELVRASRKMSAVRAMVAAKRLGGTIPKSAAMAVDDTTLVDLAKQGLITKDQARQAWEIKHLNPE